MQPRRHKKGDSVAKRRWLDADSYARYSENFWKAFTEPMALSPRWFIAPAADLAAPAQLPQTLAVPSSAPEVQATKPTRSQRWPA